MVEFCGQHQVAQGYVITRELTDFQVLSVDPGEGALKLLKIPAPLACFWLGKSELEMVR
jgi:hypothetical protein